MKQNWFCKLHSMYWTAFLMGFMGSMHCIGMCGPIALVLPFQDKTKLLTLKNVSLYNGGRVFAYSIIGILPGIIGVGFSLAGQQQLLSVIIGIFFIIMAFFSLNLEKRINALPFMRNMAQQVQTRISKLLQKNSNQSFVTVGFLNGFLPCGLVYIALAGAILKEDIVDSMTYMAFFGMGTLPMMLSLSLLGQYINSKTRQYIKKLLPVLLILMGVFFILRGTQVALPIHLENWIANGTPPICH